MRIPFFLAALGFSLLLLLPPFAHAGYTLTLDVQVFDQDFRPVEGADVYADYQLNSVTGYVKTKPHPTNSSGYYRLQYTDYEEIESQTKYTYTLYVKYGDQLEKANLVANPNESRVYTVRVSSYYAFVKVHDQKGKPLEAQVTVSGNAIPDRTKPATATGDAVFQLPPGSYSLRVEREGAVKNKDFALSKDAAIDMVFGRYNLNARVTDDRKKPLIATLEVGTQSVQTGADGTASLANITDESPSVTIKYADRYKTYTPNLALGEELVAVFDLTRPTIHDLHATVAKSGAATLTFFVEDEGSAASGIDTVSVTYDAGGVETPVPAYAVGYNTFEAKVPAQEQGSLVKYTVKIADKDGNSALGRGSYSVAEAAAPEPSPAPSPSPLPLPQVPATTGNVPTEMLAILAVAGLAIVYAIFYYLKRRKEEGLGGGVQPPAIPQQPPAAQKE